MQGYREEKGREGKGKARQEQVYMEHGREKQEWKFTEESKAMERDGKGR